VTGLPGRGRASPILDRSRSHVRDRSVDLGHPAAPTKSAILVSSGLPMALLLHMV